MSKENNTPKRNISKTDAFSSATISGLITFTLLTLSKKISPEHWISPYLTDQIISFTAGAGSFLLIFVLSYIRFEVSFKIHKRDYTVKIKFIDDLLAITTCDKKRAELETAKNEIISQAAKNALQEKM